MQLHPVRSFQLIRSPMVWCLGMSQNMQLRSCSHGNGVTTQIHSQKKKTINTDIYPHVKHFGLRGEHKFHAYMHCSGESVFLLKHSPLHCWLAVHCRVRFVPSFWQGLCLFLTQKWLLRLFPVSAFLRVWCPTHPAVLTASHQLPVAHLQERQQRKLPVWILGGVQIVSLLTTCFLLPYGIQNSVESPDHILTSARNIFLNVLCFCVGGRK